MLIKGQPVTELLTIKDTTPGRMVIFTIFIMILVFVILYELLSIYWDSKKIDRLREIRHQLERELNRPEKRKASTVLKKGSAIANKKPVKKQEPEISDEEEALRLLKELRK